MTVSLGQELREVNRLGTNLWPRDGRVFVAGHVDSVLDVDRGRNEELAEGSSSDSQPAFGDGMRKYLSPIAAVAAQLDNEKESPRLGAAPRFANWLRERMPSFAHSKACPKPLTRRAVL